MSASPIRAEQWGNYIKIGRPYNLATFYEQLLAIEALKPDQTEYIEAMLAWAQKLEPTDKIVWSRQEKELVPGVVRQHKGSVIW